jgi:DNA-binding CsgD family transcriptional regulator
VIYREFVLPGVSLRQASVVFLSAWEYLRNEEWERSGQDIQCRVTESEGFGVCFEIGVLPDPMLVVGVCQLANALTVAIGLIDQVRSALANDVEDVFENFPNKVNFRPRSRPMPLWMMVLDAPNAKSYWHSVEVDVDQVDPAAEPSSGAAVTAKEATERDPNPLKLTPREREIANLLAQGLTHPETAEKLMIVPRTAKTHAGNIARKLKDAGHEFRQNQLAALLEKLGYGKTPV